MAKASPALIGFGHNSSCRISSTKATFSPNYLVSAISPEHTFSKRAKGLKYQGPRRHASVTPSPHLRDNRVDGEVTNTRSLPLDVDRLMSSPRRLKPGPWATVIESYLPPNLRLGGSNVVEEVIQHEPLRPTHTLPKIMSMARLSCGADLLSYVGIYQERWEAVIWLVKAMTKKYPGYKDMETALCQLPPLLWETVDKSLDDVTSNAIKVEMPQPSRGPRTQDWLYGGFSHGQNPSLHHSEYRDHPHSLGRERLGQIWQSLGTMILQAADRPAEDPNYTVIMSHVFQILGHLHRINAFPDLIYNYNPPADPTVLQRPPTLYVLSKRIMSTLSDVEWGLQWEETIAEALSQGYELPKAIVKPKIREFGPELWLDLILWACVEGGFISEGAWIVMQMQKRVASKDTRWSTISWPEICAKKAPKLDWTSILRFTIDKTQLNQVGGIGIASGTNVQIDMGTRTVSREVVLALLDGLLNDSLSTGGGPGMNAIELRRSVTACKNLLDCKHAELDGNFMDAVILRVLESFQNVKEQPEVLTRFLDLRSTELKQATRNSGTTIPAHVHDIDDSAAILGLHHRNLHRFSTDGNQKGSLRTLRKIQSTVDTQREGSILAFARELRGRLERGDDVQDLMGTKGDDVALVQPPQVPLSALASFIDLMTDNRLFDLGNWLLLNEDIDGGLMNPAFYYDQSIQPALLRFGTATSNPKLLTKILLGLKMPLSEPIVHTLLHFQATLRKWTAVEELLEYMKDAPNMAWKPSDATTIAKAILQMEHESPDNANADSVSRALSILQNLVNGDYNSKADPSAITPNFFQIKMANQLGRIFQTLSGSLNKITTRLPGEDLRAHASTDVPPNAFNIILQTIVDLYGCSAGKELWDRWCHAPDVPKRAQRPRLCFGDGERVVTPTLNMLRSVLRPVVEARRARYAAMKDDLIKSRRSKKKKKKASTDHDDLSSVAIHKKYKLGEDDDGKMLDWVVGMCKKLGMSEYEINGEIPGSFPQLRHQRKKAVHDDDDDEEEEEHNVDT